MQGWTAQEIFLCTYMAAALSGVGELLHSSRPVTPRSLCGAVLFYGAAGTGLGMVCYEYLGGKARPGLVVACGFLVGVRAIHLRDITNLLRRILEPHGNSDKKDP